MIERICRISGNKFIIEKEDLEFYAKMGVISAEQLEKIKNHCHAELVSVSPKNERSRNKFGMTVSAEKIPTELLIGLMQFISMKLTKLICYGLAGNGLENLLVLINHKVFHLK